MLTLVACTDHGVCKHHQARERLPYLEDLIVMVVELMQFLLQVPEVMKTDLHKEHSVSLQKHCSALCWLTLHRGHSWVKLPGQTSWSNSLVKLPGQNVWSNSLVKLSGQTAHGYWHSPRCHTCDRQRHKPICCMQLQMSSDRNGHVSNSKCCLSRL